MPLSRFEQSDESPGFLLWQLTNQWQQRIRAALAPLGITHVQFVLLVGVAWLERSEMVVSQAILSRYAHTDSMMTSQVVRTLEEKGLLTRTVHPTDTRARVVSLTAEGRTVAQQAMAVVEAVDEQFFHELGEQAPTFVQLMRLLIRAQTPSPEK
ncbi:MAG TPA: MarR family transcriptional regulator [Ktedonobacteraceae bacterium]|nr:MarR family transcriptional regulator [Ktedonobacteraceae bacterium]